MLQQGIEGGEAVEDIDTPQFSGHRSGSVSSPQGSKFVEEEGKLDLAEDPEGDEFLGDNYEEKKIDESEDVSDDTKQDGISNVPTIDEREPETAQIVSVAHNVDSAESRGATQSGSEIQQNQIECTAAEDNEGIDAVSSEGEKANLEDDLEEEGREAEASPSPSINTRSKTTRGNVATRRPRGFQRGGRPTPIVWQDQPGGPRNASPNMRSQDPGSPSRGFQNQRAQRARRMRRPGGMNYGNMRYS